MRAESLQAGKTISTAKIGCRLQRGLQNELQRAVLPLLVFRKGKIRGRSQQWEFVGGCILSVFRSKLCVGWV